MKPVDEIPNFKHINKEIGLKFLNSNEKLYLKILNSFLDRYGDTEVSSLSSDERKDVIHTIKGLSATLGMEKLNRLCIADVTEQTIMEIDENLKLVIDELKREL